MNAVPFVKPPDDNKPYQVGDYVEAYCDHIKGNQRIKGWLKGTVVQVDSKLIAVQFNASVYLTGGWMVPDHILWFQYNSPQIRRKQKFHRGK